MPIAIGVKGRRGREQSMLVDLNTIKKLTPDRRRGVLALITFLESPECSPVAERAIFTALKELLNGAPDGELIDPAETVRTEVHERVSDFYSHVGGTVRRLRLVKGFTQAQLAKRAGIPQPHLSRIETGEHVPTRPTLSRLATALGTTVGKLACTEAESVGCANRPPKPSGGGRGTAKRRLPQCEAPEACIAESI